MERQEILITQENINKITDSWINLINSFCHRLTTPLASFRIFEKILQETLPKLVESYNLTIENSLIEPFSESTFLDAVKTIPEELDNQIQEIFDFLNFFRTYAQKLHINSNVENIEILSCVSNLLKTYNFVDKNEVNLIEVDFKYNFKFKFDYDFIFLLLEHLLENALYYINKAKKGKIYIWTEEESKYNILYFKDTAQGIDLDRQSRVFTRFFSKRNDKLIPGLGFCRLVVLQMNGDIICDSIKDNYTTFIVKFPKLLSVE